MVYAVFFWIALAVYVVLNKHRGASWSAAPVWYGWRHTLDAGLVGLFNALNGLFIVFASPGEVCAARCPALQQ